MDTVLGLLDALVAAVVPAVAGSWTFALALWAPVLRLPLVGRGVLGPLPLGRRHGLPRLLLLLLGHVAAGLGVRRADTRWPLASAI